MLKRLLRPCSIALKYKALPVRNRLLTRQFSSSFETLTEPKITEAFRPDYTKFIESLRHSANAQEAKDLFGNLNLSDKMDLINRLVADIQKNESDNYLQQIAGMVFTPDFVTNLTMEIVDGIDTLELKDISNSMGVLQTIEEPYVLNKVFMRFKALAGNVRDKETLNHLMKCYFQLLPKLTADQTQDHEFYSIADEILIIIEQSRDTWMDSDVACQLLNLSYHSPSPNVLDHFPMLLSSISTKGPVSEIVYFNLVFCIYLSLKGAITQNLDNSAPVSPNPEPGSLQYKVFVENETLNNLFPESTEVQLLNSLEQSTQYPDWRLNPETSSMKQYAELVLEILSSPIIQEFPAMRFRLTDSYMWILKDYGHNFEILHMIWQLNCDFTKHDAVLSESFRESVMQFIFWLFQYLEITQVKSHLRQWDTEAALDLQESDLPFKDEENFKATKPPSNIQIPGSQALPREVVEKCDPLLQSVVTTLMLLNKNLKEQNHMSFCKGYLEKILILLLKSLPQILETLPDEAARSVSSRASELDQMSLDEAANFQNELQALLQNPENVSFIKTVKNFKQLSQLMIHLDGFYSEDSEVSRNLKEFISWTEKPTI